MQYLLSVENDRKKSDGLLELCAGQSFVNLIDQRTLNLGSDCILSSNYAFILYMIGADYVTDKELLMGKLCHNYYLMSLTSLKLT